METIGVIGQGKLVSLLLKQEGTVLLSGDCVSPIDAVRLWREIFFGDIDVVINFHASFDGDNIQLIQVNYDDAKVIAKVGEDTSVPVIHMTRSDDHRIITLARNSAVLAFDRNVIMEYDDKTNVDDIVLVARNLHKLMEEDNFITKVSVIDEKVVSMSVYTEDENDN